jgi:hypothetical protein
MAAQRQYNCRHEREELKRQVSTFSEKGFIRPSGYRGYRSCSRQKTMEA